MLPVRITLDSREALDGFLERLAVINGLQPYRLLKILRQHDYSSTPTTALFILKPATALVRRISELSGIDPGAVGLASLARFDGDLPLRLTDFDPDRPRSYRHVVKQGWFPALSSHACPQCIANGGIWRVQWRLPIITACPDHRVFLVSQCAGCGRAFRSYSRLPLRSVAGAEQPCANSTGSGSPCLHSVIDHHAQSASGPVLGTTEAILDATAGRPTEMLGDEADPRRYLAELRNLATLLVHLAARPGYPAHAPWVQLLREEAQQRDTAAHGPTWHVRPPHSPLVRGHILAEAHHILTQPAFEAASAAAKPWFDPISGVPGGPRNWLSTRTVRSPLTQRIINVAIAERSHVGRRLTATTKTYTLRPQSIPQMIDADIYAATFAAMLGTFEWTGRLYVSLCIVRAVTSATTWADAAAQIGVAPDVAVRNAAAAQVQMRVTPTTFADAVDAVIRTLPAERDFRRRESAIKSMASRPAEWVETWCKSTVPARRLATVPHAITWMWCEVAQAVLDTSPAWPGGPNNDQKRNYRKFRDRLPQPAQRDLRALGLAANP
ncbi:TniQ family protein [Mycolicibacterium sp. CBMA 226]|uniref:TniQ family protein n=1 Tax=Mycolicibacterium sp. CBMA 226 TaxID=2606611 RepID=UPI0012DE1886|nr:TniQ family protein [Mycolicibacterium sp. CBMA 226]MUL74490.1 TniQ family protein [Mycolicibacterium sp. CBMA 226]